MSIFSIVFAFLAFSGIIIAMQALTAKPRQDLIAERLAQYRDHNLTLDEIELSLPFSERFIKPVLERLGSLLTARMAKNRQIVVQNKINLAGPPYALSVNGFEVVKVIVGIVIALVALGLVGVMGVTSLPLKGAALRRRGAAHLHPGADPVGTARCRYRQSASHPVGGNAPPPPSAGGGAGRAGPAENALPDDRLHLPDPVHRPDGTGGHHHHPHVPAQIKSPDERLKRSHCTKTPLPWARGARL